MFDAAVGIGTQALALLAHGFRVSGSDLSPVAVQRAVDEATARGLRLPCVAADFRALPARSASADVVIVCDNALPHLAGDQEIRKALAECLRVARPGGGCLISMRDYGLPAAPGTVEMHPYGERAWQGRRYRLRQVWEWQRDGAYDLSLEMTPLDGGEGHVAFRTRYHAITPARVVALMQDVGFAGVARLDGRLLLPVLIGTRR